MCVMTSHNNVGKAWSEMSCEYSRTSNKGRPLYRGHLFRHHANTLVSEIGTTSLQGTKLLAPKCPLFVRFHCVCAQCGEPKPWTRCADLLVADEALMAEVGMMPCVLSCCVLRPGVWRETTNIHTVLECIFSGCNSILSLQS